MTHEVIPPVIPAIERSRFRAPSGQRYMQGMFYEMASVDKSACIYTLKDSDHLGYPSLYRLYMQIADPTEWRFATTCLDGYEHWDMLCQSQWFQAYVTRWRYELELRIKSEALVRIEADSRSGSKSAPMSNRFLVSKGWQDKNTKGRPSKHEIKKEASRLATIKSAEAEDLLRVLGPQAQDSGDERRDN